MPQCVYHCIATKTLRMFKKTLFFSIGAALLLVAAPLVSSAVTISDLQTQIQGLLSQMQTLQTQGTASVSGSSVASPVMPPCRSFDRSLSVGSRGDDVTELQQFLSAQGYLNVSATGYFGSLTASALGRWQSQNGVASSGSGGYGIFGPLTRAAFSRRCGTSQNQQSFSAVPQSGSAPLATTFTTSDSVASSAAYSVDFGDGQTGTMTKGSCIGITAIVGGQGGIRCSYSVSHTYTSNGTYTAKLMKNTCPAGAQCFVGPLSVGTATITVGTTANTGTYFTASPTSGAAPFTVQFTSSAPQGTSIGNTVNFGDGTTGTLGFVPVCSSCNAMGVISHTYTSAGTYTATLTGGSCSCPAGGICNCPNIPILGTVTVTVYAGTTNSSIQKLNAPGNVSLQSGGIAEIRNKSFYFTLQGLSSTSATIQITPVGCWNSFPSDTPPSIVCMIAVVPTPPQTLTVGQTYSSQNYSITLTQIVSGSAIFSVSAQ